MNSRCEFGCTGEGDGAPNGVGAAALPKGDADDNPPVAPKGVLLLIPDAVFPNGDWAGAWEPPKGVGAVCGFVPPNGDWAGVPNMLDLGAVLLPVAVPKGEECVPESPKGAAETFEFCWVVVLEEEKGEAAIVDPVLQNPEDAVGIATTGVDPVFPNLIEDGESLVVVVGA